MAQTKRLDLVVIGGGPAGYVGAIRAAQLGLSVACVERDRLGGVCLNWGCIPTKALLAAAEFYRKLKQEAGDWGISAKDVSHDWSQVIGRSRSVADGLNRGIHGLFKKNKIEHIDGQARIVAAPGVVSGKIETPGRVEVCDSQGQLRTELHAKRILIATGAVPRALPHAPFDQGRIINSKQAMTLAHQPKSLLIIGAGAIGMEFAYFFNAFGTKVTVVEMVDRLLPVEDREVSQAIGKAFRRQGIHCLTSTQAGEIQKKEDGVEATLVSVPEGEVIEKVQADRVLVAIGVQGQISGLFDEKLGVTVHKGHIEVDRTTYQTHVPGIYAVGDVIGPPWLAHVASEEAVICVEQIAGHHPQPIDYSCIPGCTYCQPQVASVGLTEQACQEQGMKAGDDYTVGKFPFQASGKAQVMGHTEGFVKLISSRKHGEILGAHLIGDNVTELIAEIALAKRMEGTVDEVIATIHAHPTLSEAVHEAALGAVGRMLHF